MADSRIITGAHAVCYINGRVWGQVTSFSWSEQRPHRVVRGIDDAIAADLVPGPVTTIATIGLVRRKRDAGAEGAGLTVPLQDLTRERYVSVLLVDRTSDVVLFRADRARATSQAWEVRPKGVMAGTVAIEALGASGQLLPRGTK